MLLPAFLRNLTDAVFLCSSVTYQIMQSILACKIRAPIVSNMLCAFVSGVDLDVRVMEDTQVLLSVGLIAE